MSVILPWDDVEAKLTGMYVTVHDFFYSSKSIMTQSKYLFMHR